MSEGHLRMFRQKTCTFKFCLEFFIRVYMWRHAKRFLFRKDTSNFSDNFTDHGQLILFTNKEENK